MPFVQCSLDIFILFNLRKTGTGLPLQFQLIYFTRKDNYH